MKFSLDQATTGDLDSNKHLFGEFMSHAPFYLMTAEHAWQGYDRLHCAGGNMRAMLWMTCLSLFASGCGGGETNFTKQEETPQAVDGESIMEISANELNWTDMEVGQTYSKEFTISSVGKVDLQVYEARIIVGGDVFYLPEVWKKGATLAEGNSLTMTLTASLEKDALREGSMRIKSNDSTTLELIVPLTATPLGWEDAGDTGDTSDTAEDTGTGME
jgi:hypothetical protein